jgi:hypothetical protein
MGEYLFLEGTPLDTLVMGCEVPPALGSNVFEHYNTVLIVPCGSTNAYRQHEVWGRFANIEEDCSGIEEIENSELKIEINGRTILVGNPDGEVITLYDIMGRQLATSKLSTFHYPLSTPGIYLVKVGDRPAKKVVVVK